MSDEANSTAAVVKNPRGQQLATKDMVRYGQVGIAMLNITNLALMYQLNMVGTMASAAKGWIGEMERLSSQAKGWIGETINIEWLSSEARTSIAETNKKMDTLSSEIKAMNKKMDTLSSETKAIISEMNLKLERLPSELRHLDKKMDEISKTDMKAQRERVMWTMIGTWAVGTAVFLFK